MKTGKELIYKSLKDSSRLYLRLLEEGDLIEILAKGITRMLKKGRKVVLFGNGGSAADAQHIATEFVGGFRDHKRKSLPALALTTDTSALTAIGNDYSFDEIFSRQVEGLVNPGDVVIALSTSGNSKNVIAGIRAANLKNAVTIGFTGESGGYLKDCCDFCLCVPSDDTPKIQEAHITIGHILAELVEQNFKEN